VAEALAEAGDPEWDLGWGMADTLTEQLPLRVMLDCRIEGSPLTAAAGLAWSGDLPRQLQQVLFDTAESILF
jgi:hypothetical protein